MKPTKAWVVAAAFLFGAGLEPAGRAQNPEVAKQPQVQKNSNPENQLLGQVLEQGSNPQGNARRWNVQGIQSNLHRWSVQPQGNNPQLLWRYGPSGAAWFDGSGTPQDLNLATPDDSLREHLNLPKDQGIVVISVNPQSSAAQAGIEQSDILLTVGEHSLAKPEDLYDRLKEVGEKPVTITLLRAGSRKSIQVQPKIRVTLNPVAVKAVPRDYWIGIAVTSIDPTLRAQLRLTQPHAVIVNQVIPDSPAAKAGIALHDIIVTIDGAAIVDPHDVAKMVQAKGEKPIVVEMIGKGGKPRSVSVTPSRRKSTESSQFKSAADPKGVVYDVVHPGIIFPTNFQYYSAEQPDTAGNVSYPLNGIQGQIPQDGGQALTKRLDTLDKDLKELRTLVQELQKTAATMIERQKSGGDGPKD